MILFTLKLLFESRYTVESIFKRAKFPERVRVAVVDQIVESVDDSCGEAPEECSMNPNQGSCIYLNQIDVLQIDASLSVGPMFARHIAHRLYRGEYYVMQIDAHVTFVQDWDTDIVGQFTSVKNEMAVLTTYLSDIEGSIDEEGKSLRKSRPIMCNTDFEEDEGGMHLRHTREPETENYVDISQLQPYWAAGFSFARGHFVVQVPYDPYTPMVFQGEEISMGVRAFTYGYDLYTPERSVCFHHYSRKDDGKRANVKLFWENSNKYKGLASRGMKRLLGIIHSNPEIAPLEWDHTEEDGYGLGKVRTPEQFYSIFGINIREKKVERHLCKYFVIRGNMHRKFHDKRLRGDGMGIDYGGVVFKYVNPLKEEEEAREEEEEAKEKEN